MQNIGCCMRDRKLPLLTIFTVGVFAGMVIMNLGKSTLLENTGFLDEYTLYQMKYMTVDSSALFYYVLGKRMKMLLILAVLSTTYLGIFVCGGITLWYGVCAGAFLAASVLRYGIKGILFVVVGLFPQYIVYVPAMVILLLWCMRIYGKIYFEKTEISVPRSLMQLLGILLVFIVGCVLESFLNPVLLRGFLQIF